MLLPLVSRPAGPDLRLPPAGSSESRSDELQALLRLRIGLLGKSLLAINAVYYTLFHLAAALDPAVGLWTSLSSSRYEMLSELVISGSAWLVGRYGTSLSLRTLRLVDAAVTIAIGCAFASWMFLHPYSASGMYEWLMSILVVLTFRAIIVPSTGKRTAVLGILSALPGLVILLVTTLQTGPSAGLLASVMIRACNWCMVAVAFSTIASAVLFGLRAQVRNARKLGQYTLSEKLGEGAMGAVYLGHHAMLRRPTAIKLLKTDAASPSAISRFEREVQLTSQLAHPNIVAIYDYGRTAGGVFYYAMEYLDGVDLDVLVRAAGPMPAGRIIHILRQVASALEEAHDTGLLHRDIKPANILLARRSGIMDVAKLVDFGLVKDMAGRADATVTATNAAVGTPLYISPEAISDSERVDGRADLYALGAVGYFLLTGQHVFGGKTVFEIYAHHLHSEPVPPRERADIEIPADLEALIMQCLAKSPDARPRSARELRAALDACADAGSWSENQAEAWWQEHGGAVDHKRRAMRGQVPFADTEARVVERDAARPRGLLAGMGT